MTDMQMGGGRGVSSPATELSLWKGLEMVRPPRLGGGSWEACTDCRSQLGKAEAEVVLEKGGVGGS